jgi:adenosylmethionine-8-amino-7-oxononanoate aminotransferase
MTLANEPDGAARDVIVQKDLGNVVHPIVPHKQLERQQLVVAGAHGSAIVDANDTEYLDAMAGLGWVNIGYGRTELAAVAAEEMRALPYSKRQ